MNKALGLLLSVIVCGTMLTACKPAEKADDETTTVSETTTASETSAVSESTTASETSATSDAAAFDKFADAYKTLADGKDVAIKDSLSFAFASEISTSKSIYVDAVATSEETGELKLRVAINDNDKDIAMIMENADATYAVYIADTRYTAYDSSNMRAITMIIDTEFNEIMSVNDIFDQDYYDAMGVSNIFSSMNLDSISSATGTIKSYETEIDGEKYTFEVSKATALYYVYDKDGKIVTCSSTEGEERFSTVINEFSTEIPADIFVQPTGYSITDLDEERKN